MVVVQGRSKRKPTGGRLKTYRKGRQYESGSRPLSPFLGEVKLMKLRTIGGNLKLKLASCNYVNLLDKNNKSLGKVKITNVVENPANRNLVRRNVLTKGTVVETEKGKARITSRPAQEGTVNAVLV